MYMRRMFSVGSVENGFVVECQVPIKPKSKKSSRELCECYPGSTEKQYIAKDAKAALDIIEKLMPLLDSEFTSEDEFNAAFNEKAK